MPTIDFRCGGLTGLLNLDVLLNAVWFLFCWITNEHIWRKDLFSVWGTQICPSGTGQVLWFKLNPGHQVCRAKTYGGFIRARGSHHVLLHRSVISSNASMLESWFKLTQEVLKSFGTCKQKHPNRLTFLKYTVSGKVKYSIKKKLNPALTVRKWLWILELGVQQFKLRLVHETVL